MDPEVRRRVLKQFTTGLYVVTTCHEGLTAAGTVNWVMQTSIEPLLLAVAMKSGSGISTITTQSQKFAVNVLGDDQKSEAEAFFLPTEVVGDRINSVPFRLGNDGLPVLARVPCACECRVVELVAKGDHDLVVGEVTTVHEHHAAPPLTMASTGWFYGG